MEEIISFITSKYGIAGILAGLLLALITVLIKNNKKRKYKNEVRLYAEDKLREEKLDHVILNSYEGCEKMNDASVPYDVDYVMANEKMSGVNGHGNPSEMIQLIEHCELSSKKHVLNARRVISIGSRRDGNSIVVPDVAEYQCQIFCYQNGIFLREVAGNNLTVLQRGKKRAYAQSKGIQLKSGDRIILNQVYFDVMLLS